MTRAAIIVAITSVVAAILIFVIVPKEWPVCISILFGGALAAYAQNCLVVGQCNLYAMILFVLYIFTICVLLITSIFLGKVAGTKKR
jgi:hypothetical protein